MTYFDNTDYDYYLTVTKKYTFVIGRLLIVYILLVQEWLNFEYNDKV